MTGTAGWGDAAGACRGWGSERCPDHRDAGASMLSASLHHEDGKGTADERHMTGATTVACRCCRYLCNHDCRAMLAAHDDDRHDGVAAEPDVGMLQCDMTKGRSVRDLHQRRSQVTVR